MIIDDALNMAYSYAATICQDSELCKVSQEFNGLAGETERTYPYRGGYEHGTDRKTRRPHDLS